MSSKNEVMMYSSRMCPFCFRAKSLLGSKRAKVTEVMVDGAPGVRQEMMKKSGRHTVPQIWIGSRHVGGCDELMALERKGQLDALLGVE